MQDPKSGDPHQRTHDQALVAKALLGQTSGGSAYCADRVRDEQSFLAERIQRNRSAEKNWSRRHKSGCRHERSPDRCANRTIIGEVGALVLELM